jgi:hypothetical protein
MTGEGAPIDAWWQTPMTGASAKALGRAVALDASIAKREEAVALREKLRGGTTAVR